MFEPLKYSGSSAYKRIKKKNCSLIDFSMCSNNNVAIVVRGKNQMKTKKKTKKKIGNIVDEITQFCAKKEGNKKNCMGTEKKKTGARELRHLLHCRSPKGLKSLFITAFCEIAEARNEKYNKLIYLG